MKYTQKPAEKSGAMLLDELREQEYIMRDNQIIAEFMGLELEETLKGIYVYPFCQPYRDKEGTPPTAGQKRFARFCNHRAVFRSTTWEEYR